MAYSVVDIVNRALDYLGQQTILNLDDPGPNAARVRRLWPSVRDSVLREHVWKSATRRVKLVEMAEAPAFGFARRYQLPPDFLRLVGTHPANARVEVEGDALLADAADLSIAYVARSDDPRMFDSVLSECLSLKLAAEMSFGITASVSLAEQLENKYRLRLREARGFDAREGAEQIAQPGTWAAAKLGK